MGLDFKTTLPFIHQCIIAPEISKIVGKNHKKIQVYKTKIFEYEYHSLAVEGALAHSLQRLQNPKWPPGGPKMADGVWKGSKQLSLNKFIDPSTSSMRKVDNGEKKKMLFLVATTPLPAVDRPNADRWNAARSCQYGVSKNLNI